MFPKWERGTVKVLRTFVCTIAAVSGAKFSPKDHRTHAETTPSADETRSSFDTSTLPPQGRLLVLRVSNLCPFGEVVGKSLVSCFYDSRCRLVTVTRNCVDWILKNRLPWERPLSRSLKVIKKLPFDRSRTTFYSTSNATIGLSHFVPEM